jgi:YD repeat-containing protein
MVAVVTGQGLGLLNSSAELLGQRGPFGNASLGNARNAAYLNAATGNLVLQTKDDFLAAAGLDLALTRTYNAQGGLNGSETGAWMIGPLRSVVLDGTLDAAGSTVVRTDDDGSQSTFAYVSPGHYRSTDGAGAYDTFDYSAASQQWTFVDGSTGATDVYDAAQGGRLVTSSDRDNNQIQYRYDVTTGALSDIEDASHEFVFFDYSGTQLTQIRTELHPPGEPVSSLSRVHYEYDAQGRLASVVTDLTPDDTSDNPPSGSLSASVYATSYTYDGASDRVASITQSDGTVLSIDYEFTGGHWRVSQLTDGEGNATTFDYSNPLTTVVTDPLQNATSYEFDVQGQLRAVVEASVNGVQPRTAYGYDGSGNLASISTPGGTETTLSYDANGNVILEEVGTSTRTGRTYDSANQLLSETVYLAGYDDPVANQDHSKELTTYYVRDAEGHLRFVVSPQGRVVENRYNTGGDQVSTLEYRSDFFSSPLAHDAANPPSETELAAWAAGITGGQGAIGRVDYGYDFRGQIASSTTYANVAANGIGIADGSEAVTTFIYDAAGQLRQSLRQNSGVAATQTSYTYDGLGRLTSRLDPNGLSMIAYDAANNTVITTQANGLVETSTYDRAGRLTSVFSPEPGSGQLGKTTYHYDAAGRLRMTDQADGLRSYVLYDADGRKIADVDGDGSVTEYRYNADGQVIHTIGYGIQIDLSQLSDADGNPLQVQLSDLVTVGEPFQNTESWNRYDAAGRLDKTVDALGYETTYTYDAASRLLGTIRFLQPIDPGTGDEVSDLADANPLPTRPHHMDRVFYDKDGLVVGKTDPWDDLVGYTYDAAGKLIETTKYVASLSLPSDKVGNVSFAELMDQINSDTYRDVSADIHEFNFYDAEGRLSGTIDGENYYTETQYDRNGNVASTRRYLARAQQNSDGSFIFPAASTGDKVCVYAYSKLDQLISEAESDGTVTTHSYDTAGNLVLTTTAAGTSEARTATVRYDAHGRLIAELSGVGASLLSASMTPSEINQIWDQYSTRYTYDQSGLRTSMTDADGNRTMYFYTVDGLLSATVKANGEVETRSYDGLNQLNEVNLLANRLSPPAMASLMPGVLSDDDDNTIYTFTDSNKDNLTDFTYDRRGQVAQRWDDQGYHSMEYNAAGQLETQIDRIDNSIGNSDQLTTHYFHDSLGRLEEITYVGADHSVSADIYHGYDNFGNLEYSNDGGISQYRTFDKIGRVISLSSDLTVGTTTEYDALNRVISTIDDFGQVTSYTYDVAQHKMTVTTPEGVVHSVISNRHGDTYQLIDGNGKATTFNYDADGRLTSVADELGSQSIDHYDHAGLLINHVDANGKQTDFHYDSANRVFSKTVDADGLNETTSYSYNTRGQVLTVVDPGGVRTETEYDDTGHVTATTTDADGLRLTTRFINDEAGKVIQTIDPSGLVTAYQYDALGRQTAVIVDPDGIGATTTFEYSQDSVRGNLTAKTDANGNTTHYFYDYDDRLTYEIDALGETTHYSYDDAGRLASQTRYAAPVASSEVEQHLSEHPWFPQSDDWLEGVIQPDAQRDNVVRNVYDRDGRLVYTVDGAGAVSKREYDSNGRVSNVVSFGNRIPTDTEMTIDAVGAATAALADAAHDLASAVVYDMRGRVIERSTGGRGLTTFQYDGSGNLTSSTSYAERGGPAVTQQRMVYDANNRLTATATAQSMNAQGQVLTWSITRQDYDASGNVTQRIGFANNLSSAGLPTDADQAAVAAWMQTVTADPSRDSDVRMVYDSANRLIATATAQHVDADGVLQWSAVALSLDNNGNVTEKHAYSVYLSSALLGSTPTQQEVADWMSEGESDDASDSITTMTYDSANRLASATDPMGLATIYSYDGVGNMCSSNVGGRVTTFNYDAQNRLVATTSPGYVLQQQRTYDALGNLIEVRTGQRAQRYTYDVAGRQRYAFDALGYVTETQYDGTGAVAKTVLYAQAVQVDDGAQIDSVDEVAALLNSDDPLNRVNSFTHDAAGNLTSSTDGMQFTESYEYDGLGRKTAFINKMDKRWTYDYDPAGHVVVETSPVVTVTDSAGNTSEQTSITRTDYDALGRVEARTEGDSAGLTSRTTRYEYDLAGRQTATILPKVAVYDAANDPLSISGVAPVEFVPADNPRTTVVYDALGNAVSNTDAAGNLTRKVYDRRGQVIADIDALGYVTRTDRDIYGNVIRITRSAQSVFPLMEKTQVMQLFAALLGRAPDEEGYTFWGNELHNGRSFASAADLILNSAEAQSLYPSSQSADAFVRKLFEVAVNGEPGEWELDRYVGMLNAPGATRGSVVDAMLHELYNYPDLRAWNAKTDALLPGSTTVARTHVTEIYEAMFNRAPTESELGAGVAILQSGSDTDLVNTLLSTDEGQLQYFIYDDNVTFVTTLSNTMLGRDPGPDLPLLLNEVNSNSRASAILYLIAKVDAASDSEGIAFRQKVGDSVIPAPVVDFTAGRFGQDSLTAVWGGLDHADDRAVTMTYDQLDRLTSQTEGIGLSYGLTGRVGSIEYGYETRQSAKRTDYQYDAFGDITLQSVTGYAQDGDNAEDINDYAFTAFKYNARGERVAQFVVANNSAALSTEYGSIAYDGNYYEDNVGGLTEDVGGYLTTMDYDAAGNLLSQREYANLIDAGEFTYIEDGVDFDYAIFPNAQASADDRQTNFSYDLDNRKVLQTQVSALVGSVGATNAAQSRKDVHTAFGWDKLGNLTSTTDELASVSYTYYDNLGRATAIAAKTDARFALTTFGHDIYGNVVRTIAVANGASGVSADGYTAGAADAENDRITAAHFDLNGHAVKVVDADNHATYTSYDILGRTAKTWKEVTTAASSSPLGQLVRTVFSVNRYDAVGNIAEVISPSTSSAMVAGSPVTAVIKRSDFVFDEADGTYVFTGDNSISLSYSDLGTSEVKVVVQSSRLDGGVETREVTGGATNATITWNDDHVTYGGLAEVLSVEISVKDANGVWQVVHQLTGDQLSQGAQIVDLPNGGVNLKHEQNSYNGFGELVNRSQDGVSLEYAKYDNLGRLWATNAGDGIDKVMMYDVYGHVTRTLRSSGNADGSAGGNLAAFGSLQDVLDSGLYFAISENHYDLMGRVIRTVSPGSVATLPDALPALGNSTRAEITEATVNGSAVYDGAGGWTSDPANELQVDVVLPQGLGSGDIRIDIGYTSNVDGNYFDQNNEIAPAPDGGPFEYSQVFSADQLTLDSLGQSNALLKWGGKGPVDQGQLTKIEVYKKDVTGNWHLLSHVTGAPTNEPIAVQQKTGGPYLRMESPSTLSYRSFGNYGGPMIPLTGIDFGDGVLFDVSSLAEGKYEFSAATEAGTFEIFASDTVNNYVSLQTGSTSGYGDAGAPVKAGPRSVYARYDRWGNLVEMTDPRNPQWSTRYQYNTQNQQVQAKVVAKSKDNGQWTETASSTVDTFYDELGRQIGTRDANFNAQGSTAATTRSEYDSRGDLIDEWHAEGNGYGLVHSEYDLFGDRTLMSVQTSATRTIDTSYGYDFLGQVVRTATEAVQVWRTDNASNDSGGLGLQNDGLRQTVEIYGYDELGRRYQTSNSDLGVSRTTYDLDGNVVATRDATGVVVRYAYDAMHHRTGQVDAIGGTMTWLYDAKGNVTDHIDLGGARYAYHYDGLNRLTRQTSSVRDEATPGQNLRFTYDDAGLLTKTEDLASGKVTAYAYDLAGNRVREQTVVTDVIPITAVDNGADSPERTIVTKLYAAMLGRAPELGGLSFWIHQLASGQTPAQIADSMLLSPETRHLFDPNSTKDAFVVALYKVALNREPTNAEHNAMLTSLSASGATRGSVIIGFVDNITPAADQALFNAKVDAALHPAPGSPFATRTFTVQDNHVQFDQLGRMTQVEDGRYTVGLDYDANGNRIHVHTVTPDNDGQAVVTDSYNTFDAMNRQLIVNGRMDAGGAVLDYAGHQLTYDYAGNRLTDSYYSDPADHLSATQESYTYDDAGRLVATSREGWVTEERRYNVEGQLIRVGVLADLDSDQQAAYHTVLDALKISYTFRELAYDASGRVLRQKSYQPGGGEDDKLDDIYYSSGIPDRNDAQNALLGYDAAGNLKGYLVVPKKADIDHQVIYSVTYDKFDSYRQGALTAIRGGDAVIGNNTTSTTTNSYDQNGFLVKVQENDDTARTFINDASGVALRASWGGERVNSLVVNEEVLGNSGGGSSGGTAGNFATTYQPAVASGVAVAPSVYIVQSSGETLQSVAKAVWGDSKLWYLIADANGIGTSSELAQGTQLKLPARVNTLHNDYQSFKPYSPADLIGDTTPALPAPAGGQDGGCGTWGTILVAVIAVAVFILAAPVGAALASALGTSGATASFVAGATEGALASAVSQEVGIAIGVQDSFSWKGVALAAIGGGVSQGLSGAGATGSTNATPGLLSSDGTFLGQSGAAGAAARAVVSNVVSQGVGVVTGLQDQFHWRDVVASAGGAALGQGVSANLNPDFASTIGDLGVRTLSSFAAGVGVQALHGGRIELVQVAADAFGNALGSSLAEQVNDSRTAARINADQMRSGQEEAAIEKSTWSARDVATPGASAVLDGLGYAAAGSDPHMLHTAQAGGHYYLPLLLGKMVGLSDERVATIAAYSQFPDQVSALDGYTNGVRSVESGQNYDPAQAGEYSERAIHALNGRPTVENLRFYQDEIAKYSDDDARVGIAMHGLVDSIFHSRPVDGVNVTYDAPIGHGLHGSEPDYISEGQARTAAGQLMSAFETVGGVQLSSDQRAQAMASVNSALDRARALTIGEVQDFNRMEDLYGAGTSGSAPKQSERMELNFRSVVTEMMGANMRVLSPPEDLPTPFWRGPITPEGTVVETQHFLGGSREDASIFANRGMQAAQDIMRDFAQTSTVFSKYQNMKIDQIYDAKVWSLRGIVPGYQITIPHPKTTF